MASGPSAFHVTSKGQVGKTPRKTQSDFRSCVLQEDPSLLGTHRALWCHQRSVGGPSPFTIYFNVFFIHIFKMTKIVIF